MSKTKTYKYLYPCVHFGYGESFQKMMSELMKKSVGLITNMYIADVDQPDIPLSIFILFDKSKAKDFGSLVSWFNEQQAFVYDYEISEKLHMIVLQIPDDHTDTYMAFRESKYSKMYTKEFLEKYLNSAATKETHSILAKTEDRAKYLINWIGLTGPHELADEYDDILDDRETFDKSTYGDQ